MTDLPLWVGLATVLVPLSLAACLYLLSSRDFDEEKEAERW